MSDAERHAWLAANLSPDARELLAHVLDARRERRRAAARVSACDEAERSFFRALAKRGEP
jgi:hypothetical protein